jgi:hypothetical protein
MDFVRSSSKLLLRLILIDRIILWQCVLLYLDRLWLMHAWQGWSHLAMEVMKGQDSFFLIYLFVIKKWLIVLCMQFVCPVNV